MEIRNNPADRAIVPVIMLTAKTQDLAKILAFKQGVQQYVTKPFNILELSARVESLVQGSPRRRRTERLWPMRTSASSPCARAAAPCCSTSMTSSSSRRATSRPTRTRIENQYLVDMTLGDLESKLSKESFVRAHRSYMINLNRIKEIVRVDGAYVVVVVRSRRDAHPGRAQAGTRLPRGGGHLVLRRIVPARSLPRAAAIVLVALALVLVTAAVALGERTLALSSGMFAFELDAGSQGEGQIIVINDGDEPIKVLVYTADQEVDDVGNVEFVVPNRDDPTFLAQPSSWVRLAMPEEAKAFGNTPYLEMEPGDRVPVDFIMQPPANAAPGDHNVVLFFEMFDLPEDVGGSASQVAGRLGSRLRIRVRGEYVERLDIQPFVVPDFKFGAEVPFAFTLQNLGNLDQRITSNVVLYDDDEVELARTQTTSGTPVYAGTNNEVVGDLLAETQPFGQHKVVLEVWQVDDDGEPLVDQPVTEERTVWIFPWWLVITVAAGRDTDRRAYRVGNRHEGRATPRGSRAERGGRVGRSQGAAQEPQDRTGQRRSGDSASDSDVPGRAAPGQDTPGGDAE